MSVDNEDHNAPHMPYEPRPPKIGAWAFAFLFALLICSSAFAADKGCGVDTDLNGSVDNWCTGIFNCTDEDRDGYCTNGQGPNSGTDCNDHDFFDHPDGISGKRGSCTGAQAQICQLDGTYAACADYCPSGCLACYYIDLASGNNSNAGTAASPWLNYSNFSDSNSHPGTWHDPIAGDCFITLGSPTITATVTIEGGGASTGVQLKDEDGTEANPIRVLGIPGLWPTWTPAGTAGFLRAHDGSSYIEVGGFKIASATCSGQTNNMCIGFDGGTKMKAYNIIGVDSQGADNAAYAMLSGVTNGELHHLVLSNFGQTTGGNFNDANLFWYRGTGNSLHDIVTISGAAGPEVHLRLKHANYDSDSTVARVYADGAGITLAGRLNNFDNILVVDGKILIQDNGGTSFQDDSSFSYVTVVNANNGVFELYPHKNYNSDNSSVGSPPGGADYTITDIAIDHAILVDNDTAYTGSNGDDKFLILGNYAPDCVAAEVKAAFSLTDSIVYNPNTSVRFSYFEPSNANTGCSHSNQYGSTSNEYSGLSALTSGGFTTTGSSETNPSLDATTKAAGCGTCSGKGWNANWGSAGPTPTPTPTSTPTATPTATPTTTPTATPTPGFSTNKSVDEESVDAID